MFSQLRRSWMYRSSAYFFFGTGVAIFVNDNVVETTFITGRSMAPTLSPNYHATKQEDLVLWRKWNPTKNLQRGDVVHFAAPHKPEGLAVKRVIGLEGDTVILDRRRRPNRKEGPELPEAKAWDAWHGRAKIPPGHVWVEGDNAGESMDSNDYGPISLGLISGTAISVVWPISNFWSKPWEGFKSRTKVIRSAEHLDQPSPETLPIELSETRDPHLPR